MNHLNFSYDSFIVCMDGWHWYFQYLLSLYICISSSSFRSSEGQIYITYEIGCTLQVILTGVEFLSYIDRGRPKTVFCGQPELCTIAARYSSLVNVWHWQGFITTACKATHLITITKKCITHYSAISLHIDIIVDLLDSESLSSS